MVKIAKFFLFLFIFVFALIYFFPKVSGYYLLENELAKYKVVLSDESITDSGFSLDLEHINLSYESIQSAHIKDIDIKVLGLYNSVDVESVRLLDVASSFIPLTVQNIHLQYSVLNPLNATGSAQGEFGSLQFNLHVSTQTLHVILKPSKLMRSKYQNTLRYMHKNSKGEYIYEQNIKL